MVRKVTTIALTILFLGIMFGGLFQASSTMGAVGEMSGCSFMSAGESLCSMSVLDHLEAWKIIFLTILPTLTLLLTLGITAMIVVLVAPHVLLTYIRPAPSFRYLLERTYTFTSRALQDLFSNGILHPKLF